MVDSADAREVGRAVELRDARRSESSYGRKYREKG
jgi:hypothetical protein